MSDQAAHSEQAERLHQQTTSSYQRLTPEDQGAADAIIDATIEGLQDYATMMERGEIPMRSGPEALREFAASISIVRIQQKGAETHG